MRRQRAFAQVKTAFVDGAAVSLQANLDASIRFIVDGETKASTREEFVAAGAEREEKGWSRSTCVE